MTPVSRSVTPPPERPAISWWRVIVTLLILLMCLWLEALRLSIKPWPAQQFADPVNRFKYGSIGAEVNGFPYTIWRELPSLYPADLPDGWAHFGFVTEPGHELSIGISVRRAGIQRVGFNCATCHTARINVGGKDRIVLGAPAEQLDLQAYLRFIAKVSTDPKLNAEAVIQSAKRNGHPIDWPDRQILRFIVFPRLAKEGQSLQQTFAWMDVRPPHGPGRTDAGNVWRQRWGLHPERDGQIGTVDFPSVWNQQARLHGWFHWDGNNSSLTERNYSAALAGGATDWLLDCRSIGKVSDWLLTLRAPKLNVAQDPTLVAKGHDVYRRERCAACHDAGGRMGEVTDRDVVGTDPARVDLFSQGMVDRFHMVGHHYRWRFSHYRSSHGYANTPLDGIWARAPYIHNGSVPTLDALLSPPDQRPKSFLRGCRDYDPVKVGYRCTKGAPFNTQLPGNGNGGHEWGTRLNGADKAALLAYLRSL